MHRVLFVCHGNICRSPMAESVMSDLVVRAGRADEFQIGSAALRTDEIGSTPHEGTVAKLREEGVPLVPHRARLLTAREYGAWDLFCYMDAENRRDLMRLFDGDPEGKCAPLMAFAGEKRDVADPWYTGDFDATYRDVVAGCAGLLEEL